MEAPKKIPDGKLFLTSLLIAAAFISLFLILFRPAFTTDVDIYFLYTLAGGYGDPPSPLLHYADGMHPLIGALVSGLFSIEPGINWYSLFLLGIHLFSCALILYSFFKSFRRYEALFFFAILFLFVESELLLDFNYSGAACVGAAAGWAWLLLYLRKRNPGDKIQWRSVVLVLSIVLVSGCVRFHYALFTGLLFSAAAVFFMSRRLWLSYLKITGAALLILFLLFRGQRLYYASKIPGWKEEQAIRNAIYRLENSPGLFSFRELPDSVRVKTDLVRSRFLFDKELINPGVMGSLAGRPSELKPDWQELSRGFYWKIRDHLPFLLLLLAIGLCLLLEKRWKDVRSFGCILLACLAGFFILYLFFKVTDTMLGALNVVALVSGFLLLKKMKGRFRGSTIWAPVLVLSLWTGYRLAARGAEQKRIITRSREMIRELNRYPGNLFIDLGSFPDFHLGFMDLPEDFPLVNFTGSEQAITQSYSSRLQDFGISDLPAQLPANSSVRVMGPGIHALVRYYELHRGVKLKPEKLRGFAYFDVYRLLPDE